MRELLAADPAGASLALWQRRLVAQADSHELQSFLARTFSTVPVGTESDYLDMDALIANLLGAE